MAVEIRQRTLRMPAELNNETQAIAKKKGLTFNAMVIEILWQYIEDRRVK